MIRFHVNIDHVATLRNARGTTYPDPVVAAQLCELAGADGITAHLREDRRHITDDDLARLRGSISTHLNMEMAATDEMIAIAERTRPDMVTLVPERREERTTEGGLDVHGNRARIDQARRMCDRTGIRMSLFIAPDSAQVRASRDAGADQVELHTGEYCEAKVATTREEQLARLWGAARVAAELRLAVAAGHGLTRHNLIDVAAIPEIEEMNIGHAMIGDALLTGIERSVVLFRAAIDRGLRLRSLRQSPSI